MTTSPVAGEVVAALAGNAARGTSTAMSAPFVTSDWDPLGRKRDANHPNRVVFFAGAGAAGASGAALTDAVACSATTLDRPSGSLDGSATESIGPGDSVGAALTLPVSAGAAAAVCAEERDADNSTVRSEVLALTCLEVVASSNCLSSDSAPVSSCSDGSSCSDSRAARVERRSVESAIATVSSVSAEEPSSVSAEEPREERDTKSRGESSPASRVEPGDVEPGERSRVEFGARNRSAADSRVDCREPRAGREFDSRDEVDAGDPAAEEPGELFSPLSAAAVPADAAKAAPIPNATDRALNWPMYMIFAVRVLFAFPATARCE